MRTRRGVCYPKLINTSPTSMCFSNDNTNNIYPSTHGFSAWGKKCPVTVTYKLPSLRNSCGGGGGRGRGRGRGEEVDGLGGRKRARRMLAEEEECQGGVDFFEALPDDIVVSVLAKLSASASCPPDFFNILFTCKRLKGLAMNWMVLSKASPKTFAIKASQWSDSGHKFLKLCSDSGNVDASYTLGMIRFYCLQNRGSGASLMAKAAINSHAQALYSLAVIQFNGSGGTKSDKDLRAGVALCARAAFLGHVDALRELGHCLQDGYGVRQNLAEGRRFLIQANARELALSLSSLPSPPSHHLINTNTNTNNNNDFSNVSQQPAARVSVSVGVGCPLLSDFGCNVPGQEAHPASRFMSEWYAARDVGPGLRVCSHAGCGRPETRKHEFRRCSVCGTVNYCSRACQALDWKLRHKVQCTPIPR